MGRRSFKAGTLSAPLPPVLATVGDMENSNIITIGWTGILASEPPRTYISVRPSRYSHGILKEKGEFVINLAPVSLAKEVDYAGIYTGAKVDKFEKCHLTKKESVCVAPPTIAECPVALECRVCDVISMGTHDVFVADILSVSCDERILDENGRICFERADLLAYMHGEYYALGRKVGSFGFSAAKKSKKAQAKKNNEGRVGKKEQINVNAAKNDKEKKPFYTDFIKKKTPKRTAKKKKVGKRTV